MDAPRTSGSPLLPKPVDQFRDYEHANPRVAEFYKLNHANQTLQFVLDKKREYLPRARKTMTVWESLDYLNMLVDDSDPDIDFTQIEHALQTAEAIRAANQPRWFIVTGLVHDLGKILCLFGEPQWAVVGDTFPVGCGFSPTIVHSEFFKEIHERGNALDTEQKLQEFFGRFGVDAAAFKTAFDSFAVHAKLQRADELNRRYRIGSVPTLIVNGKYTTADSQITNQEDLLELASVLAAAEHAAK